MPGFVSDQIERIQEHFLNKGPINRSLGKDMAICNTVLRMLANAIQPIIPLDPVSGKQKVNPYMHLIEWTENNQMVLYDASRNAFMRSFEYKPAKDNDKEDK